MKIDRLACCLGVVFAASVAFAQMYSVTDLVTPASKTCGGEWNAVGINASGQVVGNCMFGHFPDWAFRTAGNGPITSDIGTLGGAYSQAGGINNSGQVVGFSWVASSGGVFDAFRTAPDASIDPATDDLGSLSGFHSMGFGINDSGQVVGGDDAGHAFRTAPQSTINPATDDLGTLGGSVSRGLGINARGEVAGFSYTAGDAQIHAFRARRNKAINPAKDDLGTLGGTYSEARAINASGQIVGIAYTVGDATAHAFRIASNLPINPSTDDLGTLGGTSSYANAIDDYGQVVGSATIAGDVSAAAFLYSGGVMHNLNDLIAPGTGCGVIEANGINDAGQIVARGQYCNDLQQPHLFRLDPIYRALVRPPINADGSSVFRAGRAVIPVKFRLTQYGSPTCNLLPATLSISKVKRGTLSVMEERVRRADDSNMRLGASACQYHYNLETSDLGIGTFRVDISINGIMVGHAAFTLR